ncbi:MAG: hypothetical protein LBC82_05790 [Oscillospiraceae bacterium]|nr:hypothetical protein [Oscillospiraceae bacterium]
MFSLIRSFWIVLSNILVVRSMSRKTRSESSLTLLPRIAIVSTVLKLYRCSKSSLLKYSARSTPHRDNKLYAILFSSV